MDVFDKCTVNLGPLGQYADVGDGYYFFPKLEGQISNKMIDPFWPLQQF